MSAYLKNYLATPHSTTGVTPNQLMGFENDNGMPSSNLINNKEYKSIAMQNDMENKLIQKSYADNYLIYYKIYFIIKIIELKKVI